jgi:hypothetical protein
VWYYAVKNYVNPLALLDNIWSMVFELFPGSIAAFAVQAFFTYRIFVCESPMLLYLCAKSKTDHICQQ